VNSTLRCAALELPKKEAIQRFLEEQLEEEALYGEQAEA
jgi:hypothetical protein